LLIIEHIPYRSALSQGVYWFESSFHRRLEDAKLLPVGSRVP
jgi:hypothetical protein